MVDYEYEIYRVELDGSNTVIEHSLVPQTRDYVIERAKQLQDLYNASRYPRKLFVIIKGERIDL